MLLRSTHYVPLPNFIPAPTRRRRFASMIYEGILLFGVVFIVSTIFDILTESRSALMFRHSRQALIFIAIGLYFILSWQSKSKTLPMKTWHMRLVSKTGGKPSLWQLLWRYLLLWPLPLLGALAIKALVQKTGYTPADLFIVITPFTLFIPTWLSRDGQFLHDRIAGTRLVNDRPTQSLR